MKHPFSLIAVSLVWLLLWAAPAKAGQPATVRLKLQYKPDTKYHSEVTANQLITMTVDGQQKNIEQNIGFYFSYMLDRMYPNGDMNLRIQYDRIFIIQKETGISIDTDEPDDETTPNPMKAAFKALTKDGFNIRITNLGKIVSVSGVDSMMNRIVNRTVESLHVPDSAAAVYKKSIKETMSKSYNDSTLAGELQKAWHVFPDKDLKVGDSWQHDINFSSFMKMDIHTTYTVKEITDKAVLLSVSSSIKSPAGGDSNVFGMQMKSFQGSQTGTLEISLKDGNPNTGTIEQDCTVTCVYTSEDKEMEIPMKMKSSLMIKSRIQ